MILRDLENANKSKFFIPKVNEKTLEKLKDKIKPVVRDIDGNLRYIEDVDPIKQSFTYKPVYKDKALDLEQVDVILTLHRGRDDLFKPSLEEVFAFIQKLKLREVVAIETTARLQDGFTYTHPSKKGVIGLTKLYRRRKDG